MGRREAAPFETIRLYDRAQRGGLPNGSLEKIKAGAFLSLRRYQQGPTCG